MTSTALHPHLHFTAPSRRMLLLGAVVGVLGLAGVGSWVAVDETGGSTAPAITTDGVPLWPPLAPPGGRPRWLTDLDSQPEYGYPITPKIDPAAKLVLGERYVRRNVAQR